jgi:hypothetical protein
MLPWGILFFTSAILWMTAATTAGGPTAAKLGAHGTVLLNGKPAPVSSALFPNDEVEAGPAARAEINGDGWVLIITSDSAARFEGDTLVLEKGTVQVIVDFDDISLPQIRISVDCYTVRAVSPERTLYAVKDTDGNVVVDAQRNDVRVQVPSRVDKPKSLDGQPNAYIVHEGNRQTLPDKCGGTARP